MTQTSEDLWNSLTPATIALQMDNEAIADSAKPSSQAEEIARLLAIMLEYDFEVYQAELRRTARWLLERCRGDAEGLRATIEAKARDQDWLAWAIREDVSIYAIRRMIVDAYARRSQQQARRHRDATTEGRRAKYASYPGVMS